MTLAWKAALPAGKKMVLLALCDNANDQGECYPSIPMLAIKCSMGERTVQQHITEMEAAGIVTRELRTGRSTIYHIDSDKFCASTPAESAPRRICTPQNLHPTPAESAPPPPQNLHPTPAESAPITINEPSIETKGKRQARAKPAVAAQLLDTLPDWLPVASWDAWVAYRKSIKAPLTAHSAELCVAKLDLLRNEGSDPMEVVNNSIMSGKWTGLFAVKIAVAVPVSGAPMPKKDWE
ncbi:Phage protein [Janthinobacterium sp. CG23_2]|nr:Phage protein [Janthinobacterium sp. CG23_2]CUU26425.1 Phage protein [Janthinobacterium sp. CG23_2]